LLNSYAELAADVVLEIDQLFELPANANEIAKFLQQERSNMTDLLAFCLQSILIRGITATG